MSRNVIKRHEFADVCLLPEGGVAAGLPPLGNDGTRVRDLVARLDRAEEDARRRAAAAEEEGRRAARAELAREFDAALAAVRTAAKALDTARREEGERTVSDIVDLAVAVAAKVLRHEIRRDRDYVVQLVRRCLRRIPFPAPVRIRLNPGDAAAVLAAREALGAEEMAHQVTFEEDRRVERGGCIVETPDFVVDGCTRTQIAAAREAMEGDA